MPRLASMLYLLKPVSIASPGAISIEPVYPSRQPAAAAHHMAVSHCGEHTDAKFLPVDLRIVRNASNAPNDALTSMAGDVPCGRGAKAVSTRSTKVRTFTRSDGANGIALITISWPELVRVRPIKSEFGNNPLDGDEARATRSSSVRLASEGFPTAM